MNLNNFISIAISCCLLISVNATTILTSPTKIPSWICNDVQTLMNVFNSLENKLENIINHLEQYLPGYVLELVKKIMQTLWTAFDFVGVFIETALCGGF